ncbi:DNA primase [Sulfolobus sp. A20]|uniref:DNA primase regulatory subunit PriL n=2 Tax=Sulfolobaceae TaxID=118883 RepID=UPI000845C24A|nr:DNA primase regulatory subunit PriL [Sulfolobus sp. A20]TRM78110.1 DNA primase regulatory subunit PriL [Sulfolobus sp. B5]TRM78579.1 DNA primase regulatory subunit PriL [Sulfolobus sp. A20-N-F8]TRM85264.1 DNA primase regulatory subunit PriL [Sulfolobus sp. F3]TRM87578.1 DNA primase regulatory subunit PriL [Sulfolobus sp. C3]TRM88433.1 DNA primase regulatory subunit PriL [Sulfolobus sp. E3]
MVIDVKKYPFVKNINDELKKYGGGVNLIDLLVSNTSLIDLAKKRIESVKANEQLEHYTKYTEPVLVFYTTLIILAVINSSRLNAKYAYLESQQFKKLLTKEDESALLELSSNLNIKVNRCNPIKLRISERKITEEREYCINFIEFLKLIKGTNDQWKLSKQILYRGNVYLNREQLIQLIAETIRRKILQLIRPLNLKEIPEKLRDLINKEGRIPPCIEAILNKDKISEEEVRILVTFYIDIGKSLGSINAVLKKWSITSINDLYKRYLGNKKTKYIIYSCYRMKELNLCVSECNVRNPLQLYYRS